MDNGGRKKRVRGGECDYECFTQAVKRREGHPSAVALLIPDVAENGGRLLWERVDELAIDKREGRISEEKPLY